jgi:hypothetical protein
MPYAPWVLDTLATYNTSALQPDPDPLHWKHLTEKATPPTWDDLDQLLAAAHSAGVPWATPLAVWPNHEDASEALITYDLPDGTRRASLCQNIRLYLAPGEHPCWGDAIMWGLNTIRTTGERLAPTTDVAMQRLTQLATDSVTAWHTERTGILADMGLNPDERPQDASQLDTAIRPYEKDAFALLEGFAALREQPLPATRNAL